MASRCDFLPSPGGGETSEARSWARREAAGWGDLSAAALFGMRDLHPTPDHISLRSCEPTLPLQGRVSKRASSIVVPANAGTHNHRTVCCAKVVEQRP
jgi:hypothetical protein